MSIRGPVTDEIDKDLKLTKKHFKVGPIKGCLGWSTVGTPETDP